MRNAQTEGFRWLPSYYEALRDLPDSERLLIYDAILDYGFGNEVAPLPPLLEGYFRLMAPSISKSIKFEAKQKANGEKGGRPPKPRRNPEETQNNPSETQSDSGENLAVAIAVANDVAIANDVESKAGKPPRASRFTPPSVEEVRSYCQERHNHVDPQRFVNFYESKGWMVGKNKMKNWKAAVRTWEGGNKDGRNNDHGNQDPEIPGITRL